MKNVSLLVWLTQLGLSVALPPVGCILLAVWLRDRFAWGSWVIWVGIGLGLLLAADGLWTSLKTMSRMAKDELDQTNRAMYNDHD